MITSDQTSLFPNQFYINYDIIPLILILVKNVIIFNETLYTYYTKDAGYCIKLFGKTADVYEC